MRPNSRARALSIRKLLISMGIIMVLLLLLLGSYQENPEYLNNPLSSRGPNAAWHSIQDDSNPEAPLIMIAFSGGGSRAAALGLSVLDELAKTTYNDNGKRVPLIDRVRLVSSVSGGSVVAAWFGLVGPEHMDELKDKFLTKDNMATLEWEAANPVTWGRLLFTRYTRSDTLRDMFDERLFSNAKFSEFRKPNRPVVVLNATDMEAGCVFAFTPERFDDICSNIDTMPISIGVAASAAFPVLLSPVNLRNHSYETCPSANPPPDRVKRELTTSFYPYAMLEPYKDSVYANALRNGPYREEHRNEHYLHLLDGGLVDNQGISSLTDALMGPRGIRPVMTSGQRNKLVFITVNARSDTDSHIGEQESVPGLLEAINTVKSAPIDAATAYANATFQKFLEEMSKDLYALDQSQKDRAAPVKSRVYRVSVDFDQFHQGQRELQTAVKTIGTSWTLTSAQLDDTMTAGSLLMRQHPCYEQLLFDLEVIKASQVKSGPPDHICP